MAIDITSKTVLVTGANRGIGKVFVDSFIAAGAGKVYAAVRKLEAAQPLIDVHGDKVVPIHLDVSDASSITDAAKVATDVDIVVNNAGVLTANSVLDEGAFEALDFEMAVNVYGLLRMAQAFAPILKSNGGGAFVQLNSVASYLHLPGLRDVLRLKSCSICVDSRTTGAARRPWHTGTQRASGANRDRHDRPGRPARHCRAPYPRRRRPSCCVEVRRIPRVSGLTSQRCRRGVPVICRQRGARRSRRPLNISKPRCALLRHSCKDGAQGRPNDYGSLGVR